MSLGVQSCGSTVVMFIGSNKRPAEYQYLDILVKRQFKRFRMCHTFVKYYISGVLSQINNWNDKSIVCSHQIISPLPRNTVLISCTDSYSHGTYKLS